MRNGFGHALLHFFHGSNASQLNRKRVRSCTAKMHVCIIKSGHDKVLVKMNGFRSLVTPAAVEQHVSHFANAGDFSIGYGQGFGPGA
jgi:hypothetical protein